MYNKPFCSFVSTGGKGEDGIIGSHRHAGVIKGGSCQLIQKCGVGIVGVITNGVSNIGHICLMAGKDLIAVRTVP